MARPAGKQERPPVVSWMLQIQYKPGGHWSDHTGDLFGLDKAQAFKAERQGANPQCAYRLVRLTTTYTLERP